jgi:hypothetical protein
LRQSATGVADDGAAVGVELLAIADDSGSAGEGVSPADWLPEHPATANTSAVAAMRCNRLIPSPEC